MGRLRLGLAVPQSLATAGGCPVTEIEINRRSEVKKSKRKCRKIIAISAASFLLVALIFLTGYALGCGVEYDRFTRLCFIELSQDFSKKSMNREFEVGPFRFRRVNPYLYHVSIMHPSAEIAGIEDLSRR